MNKTHGFALPMVTALGVILITLMTTFLLGAHSTFQSSRVRESANASNLVTESAIARVMAELSKPENSTLLVRNYDPINPDSNQNYLGPDGIPNSGDEAGAAIDEWSGYSPEEYSCFQEKGLKNPDIQLTGTIGNDGAYEIVAYRYNPITESGHVLIQGEYQGIVSQLAVSIAVSPDLEDFPGLGLIHRNPDNTNKKASLGLRGRDIIGNKGNVYFASFSSPDPSVSGRSERGDINRNSHLSAIYSSPVDDGAAQDTIAGKIIVCDLRIDVPVPQGGTNLNVIDNNLDLFGTGGDSPTLFSFDKIELGQDEVLTIDTTNGPVILTANRPPAGTSIELSQNAQIRNVRQDGQPPRVGDVRILIRQDGAVTLRDTACIDNTFLYSYVDVVLFLTSGPGCPSGQNTNFEGVIWAEAIFSAKNDAVNRDINYFSGNQRLEDTTILAGVTSGIAVPDDLSSITDLLQHTQLPAQYRFNGILSWQRVKL